jgi:hypothetical protein
LDTSLYVVDKYWRVSYNTDVETETQTVPHLDRYFALRLYLKHPVAACGAGGYFFVFLRNRSISFSKSTMMDRILATTLRMMKHQPPFGKISRESCTIAPIPPSRDAGTAHGTAFAYNLLQEGRLVTVNFRFHDYTIFSLFVNA